MSPIKTGGKNQNRVRHGTQKNWRFNTGKKKRESDGSERRAQDHNCALGIKTSSPD